MVKKLFLLYFIGAFVLSGISQTKKNTSVATKKVTDAPASKLNFEYALNDPYKTRIYTLKNGMKVYLSVYKNAPRIQTFIAIKAGSKNDPADATGLAHYLEHMVFKGTDKYGTKDFAKESALIQKIEDLYEVYRNTKDETQRNFFYRQIDSISGLAAKYAIANEYDKMLAGIGAQGTNAFTSNDQTVYVNDIPANQIETWLKIEAERFRKPVLRLFHTELEAVYEEKNRSLDNDDSKMWEKLLETVFPDHNYGKQTTIGTIEHLKNPSMKEIMKYYNKYYVPNNMAIVMSGDLDPDKTIALIEKQFGSMKAKPVEPYVAPKEQDLPSRMQKEVTGPDAESLLIGWKLSAAGNKDADMMALISAILYNRKAGLIDINLNQSQKVLNSGAAGEVMKDHCVQVLFGNPKGGQKLEEVEKLLLGQMELLKKGEFPDWLIPAIITDIKLAKTRELESNQARGMTMMFSFTNDLNWQHSVNQIERLSKITKEEVIEFAKANFRENNYAVIYKRTGVDRETQKVEKPAITPVEVDRENESPFAKSVLTAKTAPLQPVFIDYAKHITKSELKASVPLLYNKNNENQLFELYYVFDMGSNHDKVLPIAIKYLPYVGTSKMSPAALQEEFYKLGCSFNVFTDQDQTWVSLSGLNENFDRSLQLFESILADPKVEEGSLQGLVKDIIKKKEDAKLNKDEILQHGMLAYARYGPNNPYTYRIGEEELRKLNAQQIGDKLISLNSFEHRVLYYGPKDLEMVKTSLNSFHKVPRSLTPLPAEFEYSEKELDNTVYVMDYDMKQVEIVMLSSGEKYSDELIPLVNLYNDYFGSGMNAVVFQDLRESKALAYSTSSRYLKPRKPQQRFFNKSYIGSQADKLAEAMKGMSDLLNEMPKAEVSFNAAKEALLQDIRSERIIKSDILFNYENAVKFGQKNDIRKDIFDKVTKMGFIDIQAFQQKYIKGKPRTILVLGKKDKLDLKTLESYGNVKFLSLKDVFGY